MSSSRKVEPLSKSKLFGAWDLVTHEFVSSAGKRRPTALGMKGKLLYSSDGSMVVLITKRLKRKYASIDDLITYAGTFSVKSDRVLHHVTIAANPKRVGNTEVRIAVLRGRVLNLRTPPNERGYFEIVWRKASRSKPKNP